ncbi:MAG: hypothetical protein U1A22_11990 [Xanthomonadaceae bacterium]|nr:hypothetical protein [Xanthomonadaceae bacterium]
MADDGAISSYRVVMRVSFVLS